MKSFKKITELQVQIRRGKKYWVVARCDDDPEIVGTITACGTPAKASDLPEGSTFTTIFEVQ